jgi:hypothetical protein
LLFIITGSIFGWFFFTSKSSSYDIPEEILHLVNQIYWYLIIFTCYWWFVIQLSFFESAIPSLYHTLYCDWMLFHSYWIIVFSIETFIICCSSRNLPSEYFEYLLILNNI